MNKINLMDITFVVPVRIDSIIRIENLLASIHCVMKYFYTNVYVLEATCFNNHILEKTLPKGVAYFFVEDFDPIFHRTKYINMLASKCISDYIAIWDADVVIDYCQILKAVTLLRNGVSDIAFPYDGAFYDTTVIVRNVFLENLDLSVLKNNINKMLLPYGSEMGGGAIFVRKDKFDSAGGEDESFYGWGPEDWNRIEKWKKFGYKIIKVDGPLFHLSHPRDLNGKLNSEWQTRYAFHSLYQTKKGSLDEIKKRIVKQNVRPNILKEKLHIGCGKCLLPSWLNTDIDLSSEDVLYLDVTKPFPFADETFKYIFSEHVFEHISFDEFLFALKEVFRVLKPYGVFRIAMPSFDFLISLYNNSERSINSQYIDWSAKTFLPFSLENMPLDIKDISVLVFNNFMHDWGHKFIYSSVMLEKLLNMVGFKNVEKCAIGKSRHKALQGVEQHATQIPVWANNLETVVFEAVKK